LNHEYNKHKQKQNKMKHVKLFEQFVNEKMNLNSEDFNQMVMDTVSKKAPYANVTDSSMEKGEAGGSITFDNALKITWRPGPDNDSSSSIRVDDTGTNRASKEKGSRAMDEFVSGTGWNKQDIAIKNLLKGLKAVSPNSPSNT
jgi:hypothetical protein